MKAESSHEVDLELYQRTPREKFTQARVIRALRAAAKSRSGVPLALDKHAARVLRCSPSTINRYCAKYPKVQAVKREIEAEWRAKLDEILAEIKSRQRGRKTSIDPERLKSTFDEMAHEFGQENIRRLEEPTRHWRQTMENLKCGK